MVSVRYSSSGSSGSVWLVNRSLSALRTYRQFQASPIATATAIAAASSQWKTSLRFLSLVRCLRSLPPTSVGRCNRALIVVKTWQPAVCIKLNIQDRGSRIRELPATCRIDAAEAGRSSRVFGVSLAAVFVIILTLNAISQSVP